jgi:hypothetical protein
VSDSFPKGKPRAADNRGIGSERADKASAPTMLKGVSGRQAEIVNRGENGLDCFVAAFAASRLNFVFAMTGGQSRPFLSFSHLKVTALSSEGAKGAQCCNRPGRMHYNTYQDIKICGQVGSLPAQPTP